MQSLVTYSVLTKNKVLLDQIRKGLCVLGVLTEVEGYPNLFEHLFIDKNLHADPAFVKGLMKLPEDTKDDETNSCPSTPDATQK